MSELLGPFPNWSRIPFLYLSARAPPSSQTTRQRECAKSLLSTPAELSPVPSSFPSLPQIELSGLEGNSKELESTSSGRETSLFFFQQKSNSGKGLSQSHCLQEKHPGTQETQLSQCCISPVGWPLLPPHLC